MKPVMTLDEALRPMTIICGKCNGELIVYPCPIPEGIGYCAKCSPAWLKDFAEYMMNEERKRRGLKSID